MPLELPKIRVVRLFWVTRHWEVEFDPVQDWKRKTITSLSGRNATPTERQVAVLRQFNAEYDFSESDWSSEVAPPESDDP
jgi:hypothetical protein